MSKPGEKLFPHIFQPLQIRKVRIKNRIKYAATEDNFNHEGYITDRDVAYIRERAKGGAGTVTMQGVYLDPKGEDQGYVGQAALYDDKFIPGIKRLADVIHEYDAVANIQLMHCGRVGGVELGHCVQPSLVPQLLRVFRPPREMSKEEIKECVEQHGDGARRAVEAGFDIVEISGIVGYLVSNFISKYINKRTDEYGGDIEGRCRFMVEIIEACRDAVGKDVPLFIRLCGEELLDEFGGNTPEESLESIKIAERAGIDCISVTAGWQESRWSVITRDVPQGHWLYIADRVKKAVKIPVSMAYRLFDPGIAEKAIAEGKIDIWEMCRQLIVDPYMPNKILEGRLEDIRPCVADNLCLARLFRDVPLACFSNSLVGHEGDPKWHVKPAEKKKKVMIVGGGPAGLECARIAAQRGHEVDLYEIRDTLGGQLVPASKGPYGEDELYKIVKWLVTQCKKAGVNFYLNTTVAPNLIERKHPDAVVIATGAKVAVKKVPGYDRPNVVLAHDVLEGKVKTGKKVLVWGGKGPGIITALYLAEKGKDVTIVAQERRPGVDVNASYLWRYNLMLSRAHARTFRYSDVVEITDAGAVVKDEYGLRETIPADTIVVAGPMAPRVELVEHAKKICDEVYVIGDARMPRRAHNAIHEGFRTGIRI